MPDTLRCPSRCRCSPRPPHATTMPRCRPKQRSGSTPRWSPRQGDEEDCRRSAQPGSFDGKRLLAPPGAAGRCVRADGMFGSSRQRRGTRARRRRRTGDRIGQRIGARPNRDAAEGSLFAPDHDRRRRSLLEDRQCGARPGDRGLPRPRSRLLGLFLNSNGIVVHPRRADKLVAHGEPRPPPRLTRMTSAFAASMSAGSRRDRAQSTASAGADPDA